MLSQIRKALEERGVKIYPNSDGFKIHCLFHNEKTPSMQISEKKGIAHCFGCGRTLSLQDLAVYLNVEASPSYSASKNRLLNKLAEKLSTQLSMPPDTVYVYEDYRGISGKTMNLFQAFRSNYYPDSICFPFYRDGILVEILQNNLTDTENKYIHHLKIGYSLMPVPLDLIRTRTLYVVEGIYDLLTMYDLGYTNTIALLGTNNVVKLPKIAKDKGVEKFILVLDADKAGKLAVKKAKEILPNVKNVELPAGEDPNSLGEAVKVYLEDINA